MSEKKPSLGYRKQTVAKITAAEMPVLEMGRMFLKTKKPFVAHCSHCKNKVVKITNLFVSTVATLFHSIRLVCYIQCHLSISIAVWIMCPPYSTELCYIMWQKVTIASYFDSDTVTVKQYEWHLALHPVHGFITIIYVWCL